MATDDIIEYKFKVTIRAKSFKQVFENEDGTGKEITQEIIDHMKWALGNWLKPRHEKTESPFDDWLKEFLSEKMGDECPVEGFESIDDYCNIEIEVKEVEKK